jgi:hypothetical protein
MPCCQFPANKLNEPKSQSDIASKPLTEVACELWQNNVIPQMIIRSPNVRPGEFAIGDAKRLLQHNPPENGHHQARTLCRKSANFGIGSVVTARKEVERGRRRAANRALTGARW